MVWKSLFLLGLLAGSVAGAEVIGIPLKADPPFAIDGDLTDWAAVPGALVYDQAAQVVHGSGAWSGPADLSGRGQLAWRSDGLYVAARVVDDVVQQSQRGASLWRGDHLELYLDAAPDLEPARREFGEGQFQLAFSPGNFQKSGDALQDTAPEAYVYRPRATAATGVVVAAQRTPQGYDIEALVPWALLGVTDASAGRPLKVDLCLSDSDSPEARQEALMSTRTTRWEHSRERLPEAALAGTDGVARPRATKIAISEGLTVQPGAAQTIAFEAPAIPTGRIAVLALKARLESPKVAGHTPALRLELNGQALAGKRLLNKPLQAKSRSGRIYSLATGEEFVVYYTPNFTAPDLDPHYGLLDGYKATEFELDVTDQLKAGPNTLKVVQSSDKIKNALVVADLRLEFQLPPPPPKPKAGPPTGPLPVYEPATRHEVAYAVAEQPDGRLQVTVCGQVFTVQSRFSTPAPGWVSGPNLFFDYRRQIERRPEAIVIRETFTNRTAENLGIQQRHELAAAKPLERVWLGGLPLPSGQGGAQEPQNPTVLGTQGQGAVGLLPLSDIFRVHVNTYAAEGKVGIADNNLVLKPGASTTAEWAILPVEAPDYFAFLNAARRLTDVNFRLDGGFAFFRANPTLTGTWSDQQTESFIRLKDARYVTATIPNVGGHAAHGTTFQSVDLKPYLDAFARRRKLVPESKQLIYFHCFIDTTADGHEKFKDARLLRPDGRQADYGQEVYKLYLPLANNSYGPAVARNIDVILDAAGADGVYWDEHEYSAWQYHYGEPWDGVSGDIDPKTGKISRLKSSVTLLTEAWRLTQAKRILARGPLIGNGAPVTRAMAELDFMCFVETGSITNCTRSQLHSPIALGDHLTERSELDAYKVMLGALDYGCLYHWYNDMNVIPTHHHLTRYMFPITPVELREGTVVGTDRIITRRSGLHGFGDASTHEVHVFNDQGVEVPEFKAPTVTRDGKTYTELRLAEDWSAAILRK
ncbi:MAG: hypothetical protein HUU35_00790 [Armatimonadetes bacterium]|nr:hypothetical protein [Armatimonadota bacterium]